MFRPRKGRKTMDSKKYTMWMYTLRHGLGPGTIPNDVTIIGHFVHPDNEWWDVLALDRALTPDEMRFYDIRLYEHMDRYSQIVPDGIPMPERKE